LTGLVFAQAVAKLAVPIQVVRMAVSWSALEIADFWIAVEDVPIFSRTNPFAFTETGFSVPELWVSVLVRFTYLRPAFTLICLVIVILVIRALNRDQPTGTSPDIPVLGTEITEAIRVLYHHVRAILLNALTSASLVVP